MDELESRLASLALSPAPASTERVVLAYRASGTARPRRRRLGIGLGLIAALIVGVLWTPVGQAITDEVSGVFEVGGTKVSVTEAQDGTQIYAPSGKPIPQRMANEAAKQVRKGHGTPITRADLARCEAQESAALPVTSICAIVLLQRDRGELPFLEDSAP